MIRPAAALCAAVIVVSSWSSVRAADEGLTALNQLCLKTIAGGDDEAAVHVCRRVSFDLEKIAPGSPEHISSLINLGNLKRKAANYLDADSYYAAALELTERREKDSLLAAQLLEVDAECKIGRGKISDAYQLLRRAATLREQRGGAFAIDAAKTRVRYADMLGLMAQYQDAYTAYKRSLAVFEKSGASSRADSLYVQLRIGEMLEQQSRFDQAEDQYRHLLADAAVAPAIQSSVIVALDRLGWIASQSGRPADAAAFYRRELAELNAASTDKDVIVGLKARLASLAPLATH